MRAIKENEIVLIDVYRVLDKRGNYHDYPIADYTIYEGENGWLEVWGKTSGQGKVASFYKPAGYWKIKA